MSMKQLCQNAALVYLIHVLLYYRINDLVYYLHEGVLEEAKFFGISKAIEPLETQVQVQYPSQCSEYSTNDVMMM